ncbi:MAG: hypothetical protein K6E16_02260 [Lachnospiraceae bacterium]|nr:hypothetical protein [Lachnospiraceae bacterium]
MREEDLINREGVYARKVKITSENTDVNGRMSILSIASNMQDAAGDQLIDLGIGFDVTSSMDLLWVVVWSEFTFQRIPMAGEEVTFYTWPGKKMHWFYPRRAYVFGENGEELIHASYLWMLMDAKTRKTTEDKGILGVMPVVAYDDECRVPQMKMAFPEHLSNTCMRKVKDDQIDNNRHLNNAYYLDWIDQIAKGSCFSGDQPKSLWINYKKELLPGDEVEIAYEPREGELFFSGASTGGHHFTAKMIYT